MRVTSSAFGLSLLLAVYSFAPSSAWAQKIIHIKGGSSDVIVTPVRVHKFGRVTGGRIRHVKRYGKKVWPRVHYPVFSLPEQTLFPPYYRHAKPWTSGPDMKSRLEGGLTSRQGSPWRSHIKGGRTVEQGAPRRSHIKPGRTVEGGSRWASRMVAGRTVDRGSPWASTMPNWRFSGYAAPMRPKGIPYYRVRRARSPWASRLR